MSLGVLCSAVVSRLRAAITDPQFGRPEEFIDLQPPPGQPPPIMGEYYVAVYPGAWSIQTNEQYLREFYAVGVCITRKLGTIPTAKFGNIAWGKVIGAGSPGLEALTRQVVLALHRKYEVLQLANTALGVRVTQTNGYIEPLVAPSHISGPALVGDEWFGAYAGDGKAGLPKKAGMIVDLAFGECMRLQDLSGETT